MNSFFRELKQRKVYRVELKKNLNLLVWLSTTTQRNQSAVGSCWSPHILGYCFFATPRFTLKESALPNCNSLPPSTMTNARMWFSVPAKNCMVPVPSGFTV
jgi:hypothetical protein